MKTRSIGHLVAEGVFVLLGILAAFWLDSWGEHRQARERELSYLQVMRGEFVSSREMLERLSKRHEEWSDDLERLDAFLSASPTQVSRDSVLRLGQALWRFSDYDPAMPTYDELLRASGLQTISDDQLRAAFFRYELALRRNRDIDQWIRGSAMASWEPLLAHLIPDMGGLPESDSLVGLMAPVAELSRNLAFRNLIVGRKALEDELIQERGSLEQAVDEVVDLIDRVLGPEAAGG
jgi:hypothetical protein